MDDEDERPIARKTGHVVGEDVSRLSVVELEARIALLKDEIERLGRAVADKSSVRSAADAIFKL